MLARTAMERAAHYMELARIDQERMDAMGTVNADSEADIRREEAREWNRSRDREIWLTVTLPDIMKQAAKAAARRQA